MSVTTKEQKRNYTAIRWDATIPGLIGLCLSVLSVMLQGAIKRLRTRSAAVRHWRDFGLKRLRTRSCHE